MQTVDNNSHLHGLYVITDPNHCDGQLIEKVTAAIQGGAQIIQYRNKMADAVTQKHEAQALNILCKQHRRMFLINDDVELAIEIDADGVHLGQSDLQENNLMQLRQRLEVNSTRKKIIGVTCHQDLQLALTAQRQGADYVAFGRFYPSRTKPDAPAADISWLPSARRQLAIPVVAIGGITPHNAAALIKSGADMLAVIHSVFAQDDVEQAAQEFTTLFNQAR